MGGLFVSMTEIRIFSKRNGNLFMYRNKKKGAGRLTDSGTRRPLCASAGRPTPRTQEMRRT